MKYHKIVLAGGSGYLGKVLANYFHDKADEIIVLSRNAKADDGNIRTITWDAKTSGDWESALENTDLLINLCGKNVNCRYTKKNREEIFASRLIPTRLLGDVIGQMENPPKLWINITSATIYRHAEDRPQDEETGEIGYGFSIDVCRQWEQTFFETATPQTRKIALRMGIVLGRSDSAFPRLLNLVKFGLGGKQGDGTQMMNWVHEHDAARSIEWLIDHPELEGIINCTSLQAIDNAGMMRAIRKAYGVPFGLPAPQWLLEIAAAVMGTETELLLKSRWVMPKRLLDSGFKFHYADAQHAVHDLLALKH